MCSWSQQHESVETKTTFWSWDPRFKSCDCEQTERNLFSRCRANVDFSRPPLGHGQEQREHFISWGPEHSVSVFLRVCACVCVWNILSFYLGGSWHVFQIVTVPRDHVARVSHMSNLSVRVAQGLRRTRVNASPRRTPGLFCHWSKDFQLYSYRLAAFYFIPPYSKLPCDFVWVLSSMSHCLRCVCTWTAIELFHAEELNGLRGVGHICVFVRQRSRLAFRGF